MKITILILLLLIAPYLAVRVFSAVTSYKVNPRVAAVVGISLLFIFAGAGHFIKTQEMVQMLPPWVPERTLLVYLTGLFEFALAAGFLIHQTRKIAGWLAIIALILFFPANVYTAINYLPFGGNEMGPLYILIRGALQLFFIIWIYWFAVKSS